jgi:hypothetical protein
MAFLLKYWLMIGFLTNYDDRESIPKQDVKLAHSIAFDMLVVIKSKAGKVAQAMNLSLVRAIQYSRLTIDAAPL